MNRTALLLRCSEEEARKIRTMARAERRTVGNYVLNILLRKVEIEEKYAGNHPGVQDPDQLWTLGRRGPGPRSAILIRCSTVEAKRIKTAAGRKEATVSGYVIHALRQSWSSAPLLHASQPPRSAARTAS